MLTTRLLQDDEIAEVYRTYMVKDFEVGELKPLTLILELKKKSFILLRPFDEGELRGYAFLSAGKRKALSCLIITQSARLSAQWATEVNFGAFDRGADRF